MTNEDKNRDPMPPPDATPEEIGEFWDTHCLADYWDETEDVEFQVNLNRTYAILTVARNMRGQTVKKRTRFPDTG